MQFMRDTRAAPDAFTESCKTRSQTPHLILTLGIWMPLPYPVLPMSQLTQLATTDLIGSHSIFYLCPFLFRSRERTHHDPLTIDRIQPCMAASVTKV